jgi:hypothetical protein
MTVAGKRIHRQASPVRGVTSCQAAPSCTTMPTDMQAFFTTQWRARLARLCTPMTSSHSTAYTNTPSPAPTSRNRPMDTYIRRRAASGVTMPLTSGRCGLFFWSSCIPVSWLVMQKV